MSDHSSLSRIRQRRNVLVLVAAAIGVLSAGFVSGHTAGAAASPGAESPALDHAVGQFGAFSDPRRSSDAVPARIANGVASMNASQAAVSNDLYEGMENVDQSRLLLSHLGTMDISIFAYPTSKGRVCFTTSIGGGGCITRSEPNGWTEIVPPLVKSGSPIILAGIVPSNVTAVTVTIGSRTEAAQLGRNGFFYEHSYDSSLPSAVNFRTANGTQTTQALPTRDQLSTSGIQGL